MLGGALIGLIVGLIAIGIMLVISSRKQPSWDAATRRSEAFSVGMEPTAAIARLKEAAPAAGFAIVLEDDGNNRLILSDKISAFSFGFFIPVSAVADGAGSKVAVGLTPRAPQWGPVLKKKHGIFLDKIKAVLGAAG